MQDMLFQQDLRRLLTPWKHLGVASGHCVVQPLMPTVCGVADFFSPPLFTSSLEFRLEFEADGHRIIDDGNYGKGDCGLLHAGGTWQVDRIIRQGTYHHRPGGKLLSLAVTSELFALRDQAGFALRITVHNRGDARIALSVRPVLARARSGILALSQWDYGIPSSNADIEQIAPDQWSNRLVNLTLHHGPFEWHIEPAGRIEFAIALTATPHGAAAPAACDVNPWIERTIRAWQDRLSRTWNTFPRLTSDIPGLEDYYHRSLVSGLVCMWDKPDFVVKPLLVTSGMDGGAICCYPWDIAGYAPHSVAMLFGGQLDKLLKVMAKFGLDQHSRFSLDGTGRDVYYAYNTFSFISLLNAVALHGGLDRAMYEYAADVFLKVESRLTLRDHLADYGQQHNLLEMRQAGYEHFVASPNAERAWCYRCLADMASLVNDARATGWREKADAIITSIRRNLWSSEAGFFKCLYPGGHEEVVLSIQGFDALRCGACTPDMAQSMLQHVRDGAFLGEYGVSSISAEDPRHYELNDPDWSGGGCYTGDAPILALTLWEQGENAAAWDTLRRLFWMGRHLAYYPQEHYCDRPAVPAHKRANVVAGLCGAEAILFGLMGLRPAMDGSMRIQSGWPKSLRGSVEVRNIVFRGRRMNLKIKDGRMSMDDPDGMVRSTESSPCLP